MAVSHTAEWFLDQRLIEAARHRDLAGIREAVAFGADPNAVMDEPGLKAPVLVAHAMLGNFDVVLELLSLGADPNRADAEEFTALLRVLQPPCSRATLPIVGALVAAGANVNAATRAGTRALDYAVEQAAAESQIQSPSDSPVGRALVRFLFTNGATSTLQATRLQVDRFRHRSR